jgi:murein DD-endopeptidase MepM/ murein hydrolase activator NlpD
MRLNKHLPSLLFIVGFTLAVLLTCSQVVQLGYSYRVVAQEAPWENIGSYPRHAESFVPFVEERGAVVPDWTQVTFSIFPPVSESGGFSMPREVLEQLGYDPSLSWSAGQTIDQFLKLGNFQDAGLQLLSLEEIAYSSGLDLGSISVADFEPLQWQTIEDLVLAVPELGELTVGDVQPILDRLILENPALSDLSGTSLSEIIANPELASLVLGDIDLSSYSLDGIPFLSSMRLENLRDWQGSFIAGIPGLKEVPWSEFPNPLSGAGFVALFDVAYGEKEALRLNTITGSDVEGFSVPCDQDSCSYIELSGPPRLGATALHGKQWIKGGTSPDAQMVRGGHGALALVNGGKEPTGRHPFGPAFKVVLKKTVESIGLGEFAIYFRYCSGFLGCTPYFIGPVPWINQHENDIIFVGLTQDLEPPANIPENPGLPPGFELPPGAVVPSAPDDVVGNDDCQTYKGVSMGALKQAIAAIESYGGDYTAIGNYTCDKDGLCGRALGKYQFMTYNEHARHKILSHPGGAEFLKQAASPGASKAALSKDILKYFPPNEQEAARSAWFKELIDRAKAEGLTEKELIARVGEMHNAGPEGTSPKYGKRTVKEHEEALPRIEENCKKKGDCTGKLIHPAPGYPMTSKIGWRRHPITGRQRLHSGIDYGTPMGTPIRAADGGTVVYSGEKGGYGKTVDIKHCDGRLTRYAHLNQLLVGRGAVKQGQVVGKSGSTGFSTGPHLHFEVYIKDQSVNPLRQLGR